MSDNRSESAADWTQTGRGIGPAVRWTCMTEGPLTALDYAAETGETFAADEAGGLYRLDRGGRFAALTRFRDPIRLIHWSADGRCGAAVSDNVTLHCLSRDFQSSWKVDVPEPCLAVAVSPFGNYIACSMADGRTLIYSEHKERIADFETHRPLAHLRFCATEPLLFGAGAHDLLCCRTLRGEEVWQEKLWSNVGGMSVTGDGQMLLLAAYHHGVQVYDGQGQNVGAYVVEGTVNRVGVSFEMHRIVAATIEHHLYWLDADSQLLWAAMADGDIAFLHCDPLGEGALIAFQSGRILRVDWAGK